MGVVVEAAMDALRRYGRERTGGLEADEGLNEHRASRTLARDEYMIAEIPMRIWW